MEFLVSVLASLAATALWAVLGRGASSFAQFLVLRAAARLREDIREGFLEEWLADIDRRPQPIAQLRSAISIYLHPAQYPDRFPTTHSNLGWTDERVGRLRAMWAAGLSASQIARELSGVSRDAVIGKIYRLGLSGRATPERPPTRVTRTNEHNDENSPG